MKDLLRIALVSVGVVSCGNENYEALVPESPETPVRVVLAVGGERSTRTTYDPAEKRFIWLPQDSVSVWAKSSEGTFALDKQTFHLLASGPGHASAPEGDESAAYFTSTLPALMSEGTYSYYMTYPVPEKVDGTVAEFKVPAEQDGTASDGIDVLVAEPVSGPALSGVAEAVPIDPESVLNVKMKHLLHFLKFYIPQGKNLLNEPVQRIKFSMPRPIAGDLSVDVTDASTASLSNGVNSMALELAKPIGESSDGTDCAIAGIFPPEKVYSSEDQMEVTVYSENNYSRLVPFSLDGREFAAGHVTRIPLKPTDVKPLYKIAFTLASNNLGEDPQNITLTLPDGVNWPETSSNVLDFEHNDGALIKVGDTFYMKTQDEAAYRALSSKQLVVSYESESAVVSNTVNIGDLSSATSSICALDCPYLFFEDFSGVEDDSKDDKYSGSSAGAKKAYSFLNGWSAARFGTMKGTSIRIACRRETAWLGLGIYPARVDSPLLTSLKENHRVDLEVVFDYSMDRQNGGISPEDISQTMHFGYTTSALSDSDDDTGTYPKSYTSDETGGSYTNINHKYVATLEGVGNPLRLSWRTTPEAKKGPNNNTCWLYIDNIKVKIKK